MISIFEEKFINILQNSDIKVVSFDIFDTLFFRKCFLPEDIFEIVGKHKYVKKYYDLPSTFKKYRIYAEKNARVTHSDFQDITLEQIYDELSISQRARDKIKQIELDTEREFLVVNYDLERWIDLALECGKKVILISDMYLSKDELKYICLDKLKNIDKISKVYVSSEYKLTKAKGDLFLEVLKSESIEPKELFHIGDNKISDISTAYSLGINVLHYGYSLEQEQQLEYEKAFIGNHIKDGSHTRKLAMLQNPYSDELKSFYYNFGASILAPVLFGFAHWLNDLSKTHKIDQYCFIMREGFIFERYFKKLFPQQKTQLIYASRNSTFPITIEIDNLSSMLLGTQRAFSVKDLYSSLKIEIKERKILQYQHELLSEASSISIDENTLFELISSDLDNRRNEISKINSEQIELIKSYFDSFNITKNSVLVDFGAGGTIFNRIKKILSKESFPLINVLFLMNERGYSLQSHSHTLSFLTNNKYSDTIFRGIELFEILLNLDLATTKAYIKNNNLVVPDSFVPNSAISREIKESLLFGIDNFFDIARHYDLKPQNYSRSIISKILARVVELPTSNEVKYLGDLEYDEGNNSENSYKIVSSEQLDLVNSFGVERFFFEYHQNRSKYRHLISWLEGVISNIKPEFLIGYHKGSSANQLNSKVIDEILKKVDRIERKEFFIYGAGELFKELLPSLLERDINIAGVIDSKAELEEFEVLGYRVTTLSKAFEAKTEANIIVASGVFADKIKDSISTFMKSNQKDITIFSI